MNENNMGKKVFFLYPHSVIESDILHDFVQNEYEIYTLKDHKKVKLILKKYKNSIIFINIDEHLSETEWFEYISGIVQDPDYSSTKVGILTYNENIELSEKYVMELTIPCGFIQLKLGKEDSKKIILKTLEVNESKGQRKYIRAKSNNQLKSTFNFKHFNDLITGSIIDISSVGMACTFDKPLSLKKNSLINKIQLKLNGRLILVDGIIFGSRKISGSELIYVVMFTNKISDDSKSKIHKYIGEILQENIEQEIKQIYG